MPMSNLEQLLYMPFNYLVWLIPAIFALQGFKLVLVPLLRGRRGEAAVARVLKSIAIDMVNDIVLTDREGRRTQVDHIALLRGGLLVVETKNYSGLIFGQERERQWTQRLGRTSYRFMNPIHQNYGHVKAVELAAPGVPVVGWVVFTNDSRFPKGTPPGVSQLSTFVDDIEGVLPRTAGNSRLAEAWRRLKAPTLSGKTEKRAHLAELRARKGPDRRARIGWSFLAIAAVLAIGIALFDNPGRTVSQQLRPAAQHLNDGAREFITNVVSPRQRPSPPATPRPVIPRPPITTSTPVAESNSAAKSPAAAVAAAEWSTDKSTGGTRESPACVEARIDLLIDYSRENERRRDSACSPP